MDEPFQFVLSDIIPFEVNLELLKNQGIKSYILQNDSDFIFKFYNHPDSPVVYKQNLNHSYVYYKEGKIDFVLEDNSKFDSLGFYSRNYVYVDERLYSITDGWLLSPNFFSFSYDTNIRIFKTGQYGYPLNTDTDFYANGRIQKSVSWNHKNGQQTVSSEYKYEQGLLMEIQRKSWLPDVNYNTTFKYDEFANLIYLSDNYIYMKYDKDGILTEFTCTKDYTAKTYKAIIEYL